jgi:hypothetical protein
MTRRTTFRSSAQLQNAEVLHKGEDVTSEAPGWRTGVRERHVWWVHTFTGDKVACLRLPDGSFRELSLTLCQQVWPDARTRVIGPLNRRLLPSGQTVPVIPDTFYRYKLKNQVKSREARLRRRARKSAGGWPDQAGTAAALWHGLRPDPARGRVSHYRPPAAFLAGAAPTGAGAGPQRTTAQERARLRALLRGVCARAAEHPAGGFLGDDIGLCNVRDAADLRAYPYGRILLQLFWALFSDEALPPPPPPPPPPPAARRTAPAGRATAQASRAARSAPPPRRRSSRS